MSSEKSTDKAALSLLLYSYQFEPDAKLIEWNDSQLARLERNYGMQRLIYINQQIQNYFEKRDLDLSDVLPSMDQSNKEKEDLLICISKGIKLLIEKNAS